MPACVPTVRLTTMAAGGPQRAQEAARVQEVRALHLLDTGPEERFDRIVRLTRRLFDVPVAAIQLVDADRLYAKSSHGLPGRELPRRGSLCTRVVDGGQVCVVPDLLDDPELRTHPLVTAEPGLRFYAGHPLRGPAGRVVGALYVSDTRPRTFDATERGLLADLAGWTETELALDAELDEAGQVQQALLPREAPAVAGYDIAGVCRPARSVGGDVYDWHLVQGQVQVTLADVMGKGLGAALLAAGLRALLRGASRFNALDEAVTRAAAAMDPDLVGAGCFVTLWTARIDPLSHRLQYVDAGHGLATVVSPDGSSRRLAGEDLPLGVVTGGRWTAREDRLEVGETLVCCSDGVLDRLPTLAPDLEPHLRRDLGHLGHPEEPPRPAGVGTLAELVRRGHDAAAVAALVAVPRGPADPAGTGVTDDVTVLVVRRTG